MQKLNLWNFYLKLLYVFKISRKRSRDHWLLFGVLYVICYSNSRFIRSDSFYTLSAATNFCWGFRLDMTLSRWCCTPKNHKIWMLNMEYKINIFNVRLVRSNWFRTVLTFHKYEVSRLTVCLIDCIGVSEINEILILIMEHKILL